jgi:hypothetical protein
VAVGALETTARPLPRCLCPRGGSTWRTSSPAAKLSCRRWRLTANAPDAWAQVLGSGYEGYVAKDEASEYRGGPTRSWLKVKVPGWTVEGDQGSRAKL